MANLKGILAEKAANDTQWWISKFEPYADEVERLRAVCRALKSGELELWQIELAENGGIDVVPAPNPVPTVTAPPPPAPTAPAPPAPATNGAKDAKTEKETAEVKP